MHCELCTVLLHLCLHLLQGRDGPALPDRGAGVAWPGGEALHQGLRAEVPLYLGGLPGGAGRPRLLVLGAGVLGGRVHQAPGEWAAGVYISERTWSVQDGREMAAAFEDWKTKSL